LAWISAQADAQTYKIDPVHSSVSFKIRHFFSKVPGQFKEFEGTIAMDTSDLSKSKAEATIKTASIDTGNTKRDDHLRSADFFDAAKYPTITFKSTTWAQVEKDVYNVAGDLTIHGVTKPVTLKVKFLGAGPDAMGGVRGGWEATTTVDRTAFGVSWNKAVEGGGTILGNDVEITLNVEAVKQ
jgi:polyisoprenoid-binding protein YceI